MTTWEEHKKELLQDKDFTNGLLNYSIEEFNKNGNIEDLLNVINDLVNYSNINLSKFMKDNNLSRPTIYNITKQKTMPKINTVQTLLKGFGYKLCLERI